MIDNIRENLGKEITEEKVFGWKSEVEQASSDFGTLFDKMSDDEDSLTFDVKLFDELFKKRDLESLEKVRIIVIKYIAFIDSILMLHKREIIKTPLRSIKERLQNVADEMQDFLLG